MSSNHPNELKLTDPFALERERAEREAPKPEGNEAVWDDFARWAAQTAPPKPATASASAKASSVTVNTRPAPPKNASYSQSQERGSVPKTNLNDHQLGRSRSTSSGRTRSLLFWVPIVAIFAWFWFGAGVAVNTIAQKKPVKRMICIPTFNGRMWDLLCLSNLVVTIVLCLVPIDVQADGSRDYRFSPPARAFAFRPGLAVTSDARAVALQADRKIVIAGNCDDLFCVGRLSSTGAPDTSFVGPSNTTDGVFRIQVGSAFSVTGSYVSALAIQQDGKILLAGHCVESNVRYPCLARLNSDGTLDQSFDGPNGNGAGVGIGTANGAFLLKRSTVSLNQPLPSGVAADFLPARGVAMALQTDGKIVIAHTCIGSVALFCFARLNSDGSIDTSFAGPNGNGNGAFSIAVAGIHSHLSALAVQPSDGKILALGTCTMNANGDTDMCLARLMPNNGAFDADFDGGDNINTGNGNGRITVAVTTENNFATALTFTHTSDPDILIAGACNSASRLEFCVGNLTQRQGRFVTFGFGFPAFQLSIGTGHNVPTGIVVQSDGRIVLTGSCDNGAGARQFCAARYHSTGVIDVAYQGDEFVRDGKFLVPGILTNDLSYSQAIQWDDMSVMVGSCLLGNIKLFCVTRLLNAFDADSRPARTCDLDLDGDGQILATVDGLILIRIMLGIRDSSVMNGITVAATADRRNWTLIRQHLVTRCGMQFLRH